MEMQINYNDPLIMHIDLNSAYAMIEQQANPLIRNKPVAIAAYDTPRGMIIASSYEAKRIGIKLGVNVAEARLIDRDVIVLTPDPEKYFDAHRRFKQVLLNYTNNVTPKSVDEFVVDFRGSEALRRGKSMQEIGMQIKQDIKDSLGEYVTVNVGIGPNRFLAKMAAGLNKPDGLDTITGENLREVYSKLELIDLTGINVRYQARLKAAGIHTPLQFLDAPAHVLKKEVFRSVVGYYWYVRLRGHEIDNVDTKTRSFGQQYALGQKTYDRQELSRLLMKLCEKTGRRLRKHNYAANGVHLMLGFEDRKYFAKGRKQKSDVYSTQDIFYAAQRLLDSAPIHCKVTNMSITVFDLHLETHSQQSLFDNTRLDRRSLAVAADEVNDRYGEFTLVPALMTNMQDTILKRVPFGSVRDMEL
jgi:DNA polymerase-4